MSQDSPRLSSASAINLSALDYIELCPSEVGQTLQGLMDYGSKNPRGVKLSDITVKVNRLPSNTDTVGLQELLQCGMKLFDAIFWLAAGRPRSRGLVKAPSITEDQVPSLPKVAQALFDVYAWLLKNGKYPPSQNLSVGLICSFDINKMDPSWIKHVSSKGFGLEGLSGLGSLVAGYRLFEPFRHFNLNLAPLPVRNAATFAKAVATKPPTWAIHPVTRSTAIFWKRGDLEKEMGNLILDIFPSNSIEDMIKKGTLSERPWREPSAYRYLSWDPVDDITGDEFIFADQRAS